MSRIDEFTARVERDLLGLCLLDADNLSLAAGLDPADFGDARHATLFGAAMARRAAGAPTDVHTLITDLDRTGQLADAGGEAYVLELLTTRAEPGATEALVEQVAELSARRTAARHAAEASRTLLDPSAPLTDALLDLRAKIGEVSERAGKSAFTPMGDMFEELVSAYTEHKFVRGTPTGIAPLDELIAGGIKPGQLVVLAGATGSGKSACAIQAALFAGFWAARDRKRRGPVLIFSYEMLADEIYTRMIAQATDIHRAYNEAAGGWDKRDLPAVTESARRLADLPIYILDRHPNKTVESVIARVEQFRLQYGDPSLVVVDHIGLLNQPKINNRAQEIGHIANSLKGLAQTLAIPVVALAQLNREAGKRDVKRPQLSDLKESSDIEQAANIVIFVYRESLYHDPDLRAEEERHGAPSELIVAKNRSGETNTAKLTWIGSRYLHVPGPDWRPRYEDLDSDEGIIARPTNTLGQPEPPSDPLAGVELPPPSDADAPPDDLLVEDDNLFG